MATTMAPTITALQAQAAANLFLVNHLPDRFMAGPPSLDQAVQVWRVPVLLAYPIIGPVGHTGEILVSVTAEKVICIHVHRGDESGCPRALRTTPQCH